MGARGCTELTQDREVNAQGQIQAGPKNQTIFVVASAAHQRRDAARLATLAQDLPFPSNQFVLAQMYLLPSEKLKKKKKYFEESP